MSTPIPRPIPGSAGHGQPAARGMFTLADGRRVGLTFALVTSLFLLWGFCNGMIDVMDKHFQEELHLTLAQSAWVQFAHYLGYFLMSLPAGWLATRLGYKGGIIAGLLMVAVGGLWFIPATKIAAFWAFLLGVCIIASGLTFLETIANPYSTVLGPSRYAAARINLAQSSNGIGWIFGPIAGGPVISERRGNCLGLGALYLAIGERMGVPLDGVLLPGHFFVRTRDPGRQSVAETNALWACRVLRGADDRCQKIRRNGRIRTENTAHRRPLERISRLWADGCLSAGEGSGWQETIGAAMASSGYV